MSLKKSHCAHKIEFKMQVLTELKTSNISIVSYTTNDQDVSINKSSNIALVVHTCLEVPYNTAAHFCSDCKENICGDCSNVHRIFRLTRDHDISPL